MKILQILLAKDGVIIVHLDDNEFHYLKVVMDELFGRENFISSIAIKSSTPSGLKTTHKNKTIIKTKDLILVYKGRGEIKINPIYARKDKWDTHFSKYLDKETDKIFDLVDILIENNILLEGSKLKDIKLDDKFYKFYVKNKDKIFQTQPVMPEEHKRKSIEQKDLLYKYQAEDGTNYAMNGRRFSFLSNSLNILEDEKEDLGILLCDFWNDVDFQNTQNEGGVSFPASKKPEKIVFRFLKMFTKKGDLVLDSFLGSGTTAAVAQKMNRKWIGIELGDHATTHCLPRLKSVIKNTDPSGITDLVYWKGGGGFKFYTLAPSLIQKDKYGNDIINTAYNANMLAAAMAKQEGFRYSPHESTYWKQGNSTEKDYIFTTTQFITVETLDRLAEEMQPNESLLVCCKGFAAACKTRHSNITIKKIPQMLFGRCEFGKDDYSLNIVNLPHDQNVNLATDEDEINIEETTGKKSIGKSKSKVDDKAQSELF